MKEKSLSSDEFKNRGKDITTLKLKCVVSFLGCIASVFVFFNTLMIFPIGSTEKPGIIPLLSLLIGTGGFSMSMIMSVIWYSAFESLVNKSPGWQHLLEYGKSDLRVISAIGIGVAVFCSLLSKIIPPVGFALLLLSTFLVVVLVGYLIHQINTHKEQKNYYA